jgi:hypothetical protein
MSAPAETAGAIEAPLPAAGDSIDERFTGDVKAAFASYRAWGRVDDELRWAPFLCRLPNPGRPAMSAAKEGGHARKLYSLFAKDRASYIAGGGADSGAASSVGQAIVKESYLPEVVQTGALPGVTTHGRTVVDGTQAEADHFDPYVKADGVTYHAGVVAGIYVMLRRDPKTTGTDDGWVYGTLRPNGEVTSAGRVPSCMRCHTTKSGRLFGSAPR